MVDGRTGDGRQKDERGTTQRHLKVVRRRLPIHEPADEEDTAVLEDLRRWQSLASGEGARAIRVLDISIVHDEQPGKAVSGEERGGEKESYNIGNNILDPNIL